MSKEDLQKVSKLSKEEVIAKMRSGEVVPPIDKKERVEFLSFVSMSDEERNKVLNPEPNPGEKDGEGKPVVPPAAAVEVKKDPEPPKEPWWKALGYESEEKAAEAHINLVETSANQKSIIDGLNARGDQRGKELKRLRDANEKLIKDMEAAKAAAIPKIEKPQRPKRPDPKLFEDGALDEKYTEAFAKYEADLDSYEQANEVYLTETITRKSTPPPEPPAPPVIDNEPWNKLWNNDIPEFQKQQGLVTTVSIKQISDAYNGQNGNDPEIKARASAFLKTVPPADLAVFDKVKQAVEVAYDFTSGVPESKYRTIAGALFDNNLIGEGKPFNIVVPVRMTAAEEAAARELERRKKEGTATPPPASAMASGDKNVGDMASVDQKTDRYRLLTQSYNVALNKGPAARDQFEASTEYQEMLALGRELGYRRK